MLGVFGCQKEDDSVHKHENTSRNKNYKIKKISWEEMQGREVMAEAVARIPNNLDINSDASNRLVYYTNLGFYIETEEVTYMESEDGSYHSYTFQVIRDNPEDKLENLVFSFQQDSTYKIKLITYDVSSEEKESLLSGSYVSLEGKVTKQELKEVEENGELELKMDMGCADVYFEYCTEGYDHSADGTSCGYIASAIITICSGGGGGGDPEYPDNSGTPDGENYEGGGNPTNPNNTNNDATTPVVTIPYAQSLIECLQLDLVENANQPVGGWINNSDNFIQMRDASMFLKDKNCNENAQTFVIASIEAILNGDIEEFDENLYVLGVTKDDTFVDTQLDCIYEKLKGGSIGNNFFKEMLLEFDQLNAPLKFSIGSTPNNDYAFTKGEITTIFGQTHASYEIISNPTTEEASNLKKIVSLSHELMHSFMYKSLEEFGIIEFNNEGYPTAEVSAICDDFQIVPDVNLNTYIVKDRWVYLICEFSENNPGNQQWTHSLFNSPVFAVETYREKLEQILIDNHDWESEPSSLQNLAINQFGPNWKNEVAEYMSWLGLQATPEFEDWLVDKGVTYNYWNNSIGPWNNSDWVVNDGVLHNCE